MGGNSKKTIVRSVRASQEFWDRLKNVALKKETDPNKLIVRVVGEYCNKEIDNGRKQD
jgi:predicted DNA-binding ribbon-helix-helix protein